MSNNDANPAQEFTIGRRTALAGAIALGATSLMPAAKASATTGITWTVSTSTSGSPPVTDLWMKSYLNGVGQFDYRFGSGGCLAQMRYCPAVGGVSNRPLLAPTFLAGQETDRVMQGVLWGMNVSSDTSTPELTLKSRWNVNQAGVSDNTYSRIVAVERPLSSIVDVWTIADRQWYPQYGSAYAGSDPVPMLTRYTMNTDGSLEIRRILRLPKVVKNTTVQSGVQFYLENWLPFLRSTSPAFNAVAPGLNPANGAPTWWYLAGTNVPQYGNGWPPNLARDPINGFPLTKDTNGYAVVYQNGQHATQPVVGVAFSKSPGLMYSTSATVANVINLKDWDASDNTWDMGIGVLPGVLITNAQADSILDYAIRILPAAASNAAFVSTLTANVSQLAAPTLYGPSYAFGGGFATTVSRLRSYATSTTGIRTNHMGAP